MNNDKPINKDLIKIETRSHEPWKLVYLNLQSLITENSKMKVDHLNVYTKDNNVTLISMTKDMA